MATAYLDANPPYVIVQRGDTLSQIALDYKSYSGGASYQQLAAINNISNANLIYVGQKIYLKDSSGSTSTDSTSSDTSKATIDQFGHQSNSSGTMFATWSWSKSNTKHYEVEWTYDTGDNIWFIGNKSTTEDKQSTFNIPSNATRVRFRVKPVSKTYTSNNKETSYWTANWSTYELRNVKDITPPSVPPVPTVTIDKYTLTASLDNLDVNASKVEFKIVKNDASTFKTGTATIETTHAAYSCAVDAGGRYKVACRSYDGEEYSDWSDYSANVSTIPAASSGITTCRASSESSVYLEWEAVDTADTYTLEYTTKTKYFDGSDQVTSITGIKSTHYEKTGLESGQEYFFRVCAVNEQGESGWSDIKSVIIGKKPSAPTTWSSTTKAVAGENVTLYWVHNSEDGSSQTYAELEITINDNVLSPTILIKNSTDEDEKDKTLSCTIDTLNDRIVWTEDGVMKHTSLGINLSDGHNIKWRVRTAGVTDQFGDYSVQRTIDIYAPATLKLTLLKSVHNVGESIRTLTAFPAYIHGLASPNTQAPIGYHVSVVSNKSYTTVDSIGNRTTISKGQEVYSKYFDITNALMVELSAGNIDLENNVSYTINCTVSMNSGLTAEASLDFTVSWAEVAYEPNAEISLDEDRYMTHIRPFCRSYLLSAMVVEYKDRKYIKTSVAVKRVYGEIVKNCITTTGEQVYFGTSSLGEEIYYCFVEKKAAVKGVSLAVYRREFDGGFTELAKGLPSNKNTVVTDPHPALDYARYRIVATTDATGAVSYCDLPGFPIGGTAAIIQWDEEWSAFDVNNEDAVEDPAWTGSLLKLPYNIDVSDSASPDVELVEYIGREHPVGYYGTQRGHTSTWNVEIPANDEETLYTIRRLQNWMGNAYVREPSGSGYWANVKVSFSQKHRELTIPITFTITRVEGGA